MRNLLRATSVAFVLLCGFTGRPAAAADADLKITVTNGNDTKGDVRVQIRPAGQHGGDVIASGGSGDDIAVPSGTYDVDVNYNDGAANKTIWFDKLALSGHVVKTVDMALPVAALRIVITNGGKDVGGDGKFSVRPPGKHDADVIAYDSSGGTVRVPAGTYSVDVRYGDGAANKTVWLDGLALSGKVDKTVEMGIKVAALRIVITNGGKDVGGDGKFSVRPPGKHDADVIAFESSGGTVRVPAGTYSVDVRYQDGAASKTVWLDGLALAGNVAKTVEMGTNVAALRIVITNGGKDVGGNGTFSVRPPGKHDADVITFESSGGTVRVPAGTYSVDVRYQDGAASKTVWLDGLALAGKVDKTVEMGAPVADVIWHIVNHGQDVGSDAKYQIRPDGNHQGDVIAGADSGQPSRLAAGTYDVDILYSKGMVNKMIWFDHQTLKDRIDRTTDLALNLARPTVSATLNGKDVGAQARIGITQAGKDEEVGSIQGGETAELESGRYSFAATMPGAEGTLGNATIAGQPHLVVAMKALQTAELKPGGPPPKTCTIEVYGVNFDFDKATLRSDSEPELRAVLQLFTTTPSFGAEVGGHTDNIGKAEYNIKLSEARAAAVKAWLVAHGVAAGRVTSRGYGDTRPLVANDTDANRFKNRRVELRRTNCI